MEYNDDQIKHILNVYKTQREKDKEIYLKRKQDPEFMEKNRERSRKDYEKNKDNRRCNYQENKELQRSKCSYHYYLKNNNIEKFKEKFPDRFEMLEKINYFKEKIRLHQLTHQMKNNFLQPPGQSHHNIHNILLFFSLFLLAYNHHPYWILILILNLVFRFSLK